MRGTVAYTLEDLTDLGIIPACAGNSASGPHGTVHLRDHPRVCGEQRLMALLKQSVLGSSPRVRGTEIVCHLICRSVGIIPACAGNRTNNSGCLRAPRDHPRVCGEQPETCKPPTTPLGSSPRVRGTATLDAAASAFLGIIPACAGNSAPSLQNRFAPRDHPRVCGEQVVGQILLGIAEGIIPACAGNSRKRLLKHPEWWDHPRVCGEQSQPCLQPDRR